jgi:MFS family permease
VLAVSAGLLAAGLLGLGFAHSLPAYLLAWLVIGLGMGAGLYDPAFATLGRLYGHAGRSAITTLTLFGGFASTVCWPLSAFLEAHLGWRGACIAYASFHLCVALPTYLLVLPREPRHLAPSAAQASGRTHTTVPSKVSSHGLLPLLATSITLASVISTALSVHLLSILQAKGFALATAVSLGALVGPSQVGARTIEMLIARFHHPIWTKIASASLVAAGLTALWTGAPVIVLALVLYGAGIGLESIARGTLPLAIFGPERFPIVVGRIAMPSLVAQAAAPSIGVALFETVGFDGALRTIVAAAICNVLLALVLFLLLRKRLVSR